MFSTVGDNFSTAEVAQYSRGITSVHAGGSHQYCGEGGGGEIASALWRVFSTLGEGFQCRHVWPLKTTERYR